MSSGTLCENPRKPLLEEHNATRLMTCLVTYPAIIYWKSESKPQALTGSLLRKFSRKRRQEKNKGLSLRGRGDTGANLDHTSQGGFQKPRTYLSFEAPESQLSQTYLCTSADNSLSHRNILFRVTVRKQYKFILSFKEVRAAKSQLSIKSSIFLCFPFISTY